MKPFKRPLGAAVASILTALALSGCGGAKETAESGKEIVFWHWWTDRQPVLDELAARYQKEKGVRVRFQVAAPVGSEYNNKLQAAAQADTLPDIIGLAAGGEFLARYINAGKIVDLTEAMNGGWKDKFYPRAVQDFTYTADNRLGVKPGTIWAAPISAMAIQIFYNKDHFEKAGLDPEAPPQTWSQFLAAGQKLKDAGIIPFGVGFGDLWMIGAFLEPYAWSYLGQEKIRATFLGKHPYTSPEWVKVLNLFSELKGTDMLVKGSVTLPNKESEQLFASGRVAMTMNGSWGVNVFKGMNPNLRYGVMRLPRPENAPFPLYVRGGVGSGAAVTSNSRNTEQAVEFLKWLTDTEQQKTYANRGLDLPANRHCEDGLMPVLAQFASAMNDLIPDIQAGEKYEVQEVLWKGVQSIFIGQSTPREVLVKVQAAKQKSLKGI
jgi:ABC-type glycerol-3-phosphate transport system substrate-binding protein